MPKSDIVPVVPVELVTYDRNSMSYEELQSSGFTIEMAGSDLLSSENGLIATLIGVPHIITGAYYREGIEGGDFVSLEAIIGTEKELTRRRIDLDSLPFEPLDHVVYNDGSTGIYRQITECLYTRGIIALPQPIVPNGKRGECSWDAPTGQWLGVNSGNVIVTLGESGHTDVFVPIQIKCPRGLRASEYDWEKKRVTTYYIA